MAHVVEFSPNEAEMAEPPTAPHRGLLVLSRALAILFTIFIALLALSVAAWFVIGFFFGDYMLVGADGVTLSFGHVPRLLPGTVRFSTQPFLTHLAGMADIVIATVPILFVFWHLRGLFRLYARGIVFARENAVHLKLVGLWLVVYPFAKFAANMVFRLAGGTDKAWFRMELIDALILGLIVFVIAQVMEFGRDIEQEKDSFI